MTLPVETLTGRRLDAEGALRDQAVALSHASDFHPADEEREFR